MTGIHIENFAGIAPKYSEKKLADNLATKAENVRLESASIEAYKAPLAIGESVGASDLSAYPYLLIWLTSAFRRQYVDSLVPHDVRETLFYNDADYPKIRTGGAEYRLGIPRPGAPTTSITDGGDTSDLTFIRLQSYKVTFVDIWGYEGPPSDASIAVEVGQGSTVNVDLPATPSGSHALDKIRLYRSNTGSNTTYFQFVTEVAIGTGDYDDSIPSEYLQESIPSDEWIGPPDDDLATYPQGPLASLVELPGGVMAGHSGNSVYFSEPYVPTAWPERYRVTRDRQVVALCPVSGGLFVATNKQPYLIAGTQPGSMVAVPIESNQACVSQASMVNMGDYCIYASPDGLVMGQGNAAKLLTEQWLSPREWQAQFNPTTIRAFPYEGKYLAFFGDALDGTGFVFDPSEGLQGLFTLQGVKVQGGHWEAKTDRLYLLHTTDDVNWELGEFNEGSDLTWTWHSKDFKAPLDLNMVCYRIEAESYPISLEIWADGVQKAVIEVPDSATHRLPRGFKARRWQIRVSGTGRMDSVGIWDSMSEVS